MRKRASERKGEGAGLRERERVDRHVVSWSLYSDGYCDALNPLGQSSVRVNVAFIKCGFQAPHPGFALIPGGAVVSWSLYSDGYSDALNHLVKVRSGPCGIYQILVVRPGRGGFMYRVTPQATPPPAFFPYPILAPNTWPRLPLGLRIILVSRELPLRRQRQGKAGSTPTCRSPMMPLPGTLPVSNPGSAGTSALAIATMTTASSLTGSKTSTGMVCPYPPT
jgi:hypothetical protein